MAAFEIGDFRLITSGHQRFKTSLDQLGNTAAQYGLFTKEVGFGLFLERSFNNAGTGAADPLRIGKGFLHGFAGSILINGHHAGHTAAFGIGAAYQMPRSLGSDHVYVNILGRNNLTEVNIEAVSKQEGLAGLEIGLDILTIHLRLMLVGQQNHDDVGSSGRFGGGHGSETMFPGKLVVGTARTLTHDDVDAGVTQILGMGMPLAAVADDGNGLALKIIQVGILFVIGFHDCSLQIQILKQTVAKTEAKKQRACAKANCSKRKNTREGGELQVSSLPCSQIFPFRSRNQPSSLCIVRRMASVPVRASSLIPNRCNN